MGSTAEPQYGQYIGSGLSSSKYIFVEVKQKSQLCVYQ